MRAVGRGSRCRDEVEAGDDRPSGPLRPIEGDRDQLVDHQVGPVRFVPIVRLAHGEQPIGARSEHEVREAPRTLRGDGPRRGETIGIDLEQATVRQRRHDHAATVGQVGPAAVLVHLVADPERGRGQLARHAVETVAHQRLAAGLGRPALDPVHASGVDPRLTEAPGPARRKVEIDRRAPAAVRCDRDRAAHRVMAVGFLGPGLHPQVPCCQDDT